MRYLIFVLYVLLLTSCGTYQISTKDSIKIAKVLTITSTGDTLAVPIRQFQKYNYNNVFDNYRFNYGFNTWGNWGYPYFGWNYNYLYRPNSWYFRDFYYNPPLYRIVPEKPKVRYYSNGRRGSNNIIITPNSNRGRSNNNEGLRNFNRYTPRENPNNNIITPPNRNSIPPKPNVNKPQIKPRLPVPSIKPNNSSSRGVRGNSNGRN